MPKVNRYRYVITKRDTDLLPYGVEIYKNGDKKPFRSLWFQDERQRMEGLKIVAKLS